MPEGDTVWQAARRLDRALGGKTLTASDFRVPQHATANLAGERIDQVVSRGKHLLARIGPWTLHTHLKMEGVWHVYLPGERWRRPAHTARVVLKAEDVEAVGFSLGVVELLKRDDEVRAVGHLGPDLLDPNFDIDEAVRRLEAVPDQPVFVALLDQRNLAGLGNEYVNELLFLSGLLPTRPVGEVGDLRAVVARGRHLLNANKDRRDRVFTGSTRRGETRWVYRRERELCRRCGTPLRRGELGAHPTQERITFWCPSCQT